MVVNLLFYLLLKISALESELSLARTACEMSEQRHDFCKSQISILNGDIAHLREHVKKLDTLRLRFDLKIVDQRMLHDKMIEHRKIESNRLKDGFNVDLQEMKFEMNLVIKENRELKHVRRQMNAREKAVREIDERENDRIYFEIHGLPCIDKQLPPAN
jgi:hypothetical protein